MKEVKNVENGISFALSRGRVILWGKKNLFVNTVYTPISVKNAAGVFVNMDKDMKIVKCVLVQGCVNTEKSSIDV
jgi:hypothetical protein